MQLSNDEEPSAWYGEMPGTGPKAHWSITRSRSNIGSGALAHSDQADQSSSKQRQAAWLRHVV